MESAGEMIRHARKAKGLSVEGLAALTRVQADYLKALEEDRYEIFPAQAYAVGFIRNCARALDLDEKELLRRYHAEAGVKGEEEDQLWGDEPEEPTAKRRGWVLPVAAGILLALIAAAYFLLVRRPT